MNGRPCLELVSLGMPQCNSHHCWSCVAVHCRVSYREVSAAVIGCFRGNREFPASHESENPHAAGLPQHGVVEVGLLVQHCFDGLQCHWCDRHVGILF